MFGFGEAWFVFEQGFGGDMDDEAGSVAVLRSTMSRRRSARRAGSDRVSSGEGGPGIESGC